MPTVNLFSDTRKIQRFFLVEDAELLMIYTVFLRTDSLSQKSLQVRPLQKRVKDEGQRILLC